MKDLFGPTVKRTRIKNGEWWQGDCLDLMQHIPTGSVDMVLCDLPYGTTACKWDTVIPFEPLWREYHRIAKERAAIVLTASQPFTSALVMSNAENFKYSWVWDKKGVTGFANAKKQPLRHLEDVVVFCKSSTIYNPQGLIEINKINRNTVSVGGDTLRTDVERSKNKGSLRTEGKEYLQQFTNYPKQRLAVSRDKSKIHPTQKPVALFEYLIKTYTQPGDLILDNTAGSGTTAVAAENTGRRWLCIERDAEYSRKAIERIRSCI